jgi:hypothetical protein
MRRAPTLATMGAPISVLPKPKRSAVRFARWAPIRKPILLLAKIPPKRPAVTLRSWITYSTSTAAMILPKRLAVPVQPAIARKIGLHPTKCNPLPISFQIFPCFFRDVDVGSEA